MVRVVAGVLVAALVWFPTVRAADQKPFPPDDWTHKELAAHLGKKGVAVEVESALALNTDGRTASLFVAPGGGGGAVVVFLCRDERQARETAGSFGAKGFHKGRFAFGVNRKNAPESEKFLEQMEAALKP